MQFSSPSDHSAQLRHVYNGAPIPVEAAQEGRQEDAQEAGQRDAQEDERDEGVRGMRVLNKYTLIGARVARVTHFNNRTRLHTLLFENDHANKHETMLVDLESKTDIKFFNWTDLAARDSKKRNGQGSSAPATPRPKKPAPESKRPPELKRPYASVASNPKMEPGFRRVPQGSRTHYIVNKHVQLGERTAFVKYFNKRTQLHTVVFENPEGTSVSVVKSIDLENMSELHVFGMPSGPRKVAGKGSDCDPSLKNAPKTSKQKKRNKKRKNEPHIKSWVKLAHIYTTQAWGRVFGVLVNNMGCGS